MRLILIRHGETDSNVHHLLDTAFPGAPLNQTGRQQAAALPAALAAEPITAIWSSDITRAVMTAAPLAEALSLEPQQLSGLREIQAGDLEMAHIPDCEYVQVIASWLRGDDTATIPGGDTCATFFTRYDDALAQIEAAGQECVAVVSHGAAIRAWAGRRVRNISAEFAARSRLDNTTYLILEGSRKQKWVLESWGDAGPDGLSEPQP